MAETLEEAFNRIGYTIKAYDKLSKFEQELQDKNGNYYESELFQIIDRFVIGEYSSKFKAVIKSGTKLYRARIISAGDYLSSKGFKASRSGKHTTGYNESNSIEPPLGKSPNGRNNIQGASYLYVANSVETACAEVKPDLSSLISVASFEVVSDLTIYDFYSKKGFKKSLRDDYDMSLGVLFSGIMQWFYRPIGGDYSLSQILSDYLRKTGIDGIAYRSFFTNGINYTIYNSFKSKIKFIESQIIVPHQIDYVCLDLNSNETFHTLNGSREKWNEEETRRHQKWIDTISAAINGNDTKSKKGK